MINELQIRSYVTSVIVTIMFLLFTYSMTYTYNNVHIGTNSAIHEARLDRLVLITSELAKQHK